MPAEFTAIRHVRGVLSMGNSGKNSNTSQFFFTFGKAKALRRYVEPIITHGKDVIVGEGDQDNGRFTIDANGTLKTAESFDFETKPNLSIRVRVTDDQNRTFDKVFAINVTDDTSDPGDITLSNNTVAENTPPDTVVGHLQVVDPDDQAQGALAGASRRKAR